VTQFVNGSFGLPVTIHARNDYSICDALFFGPRWPPVPDTAYRTEVRTSDNAVDEYIFRTKFWPRGNSAIIGGWSGSADDLFQGKPQQWIAPRIERGANGRLSFVGYTRDQYGSPTGNCTVRCYRTSTEELVSKVTSDANGLYYATTPYNDSHFLVIHSPATGLAGATRDSLTPG
jgi:hypothetical protein